MESGCISGLVVRGESGGDGRLDGVFLVQGLETVVDGLESAVVFWAEVSWVRTVKDSARSVTDYVEQLEGAASGGDDLDGQGQKKYL